jgi:hypothetical protein
LVPWWVTCGRRVRWQGEVISAGREGREREHQWWWCRPTPRAVRGEEERRERSRREQAAVRAHHHHSLVLVLVASAYTTRLFFTVRACQPARKMDSILCRPRTKIPLHVNYCTLYLDHFHVLYLGAAPRSNQCHFSPRYQVCLRVWHPEQAVLFLDEILPRSGLTTASFCFH